MKPSLPVPVSAAAKSAAPVAGSARRGPHEFTFGAALDAASTGAPSAPASSTVPAGAGPIDSSGPPVNMKELARAARNLEASEGAAVSPPAAAAAPTIMTLLGVSQPARTQHSPRGSVETSGDAAASAGKISAPAAAASISQPGRTDGTADGKAEAGKPGENSIQAGLETPAPPEAGAQAEWVQADSRAVPAPSDPKVSADGATPLKNTTDHSGKASPIPVRLKDPAPAEGDGPTDVKNAPGSRAALHARAAASPGSELASAIAQRVAAQVQEMHVAPLPRAGESAEGRASKHEAGSSGPARVESPAPVAAESSAHANPDAAGRRDASPPPASQAEGTGRTGTGFEEQATAPPDPTRPGPASLPDNGRPSISSPNAVSAPAAAPAASAMHGGAVKILDQMVQQIQVKQLGPETTRATVRLNPENLGQVEIRIEMENGHLRAHFVAASPEVREALRQHLPELERALAANRGSSSSLSVDLGRQGDQADKPYSESKPARMKRAPSAADVVAASDPRPRRDSGLDLYA